MINEYPRGEGGELCRGFQKNLHKLILRLHYKERLPGKTSGGERKASLAQFISTEAKPVVLEDLRNFPQSYSKGQLRLPSAPPISQP